MRLSLPSSTKTRLYPLLARPHTRPVSLFSTTSRLWGTGPLPVCGTGLRAEGTPVPDHGARLPRASVSCSDLRHKKCTSSPLQPIGPPGSCSQRQLRAHDAEPCPAPGGGPNPRGVEAGVGCRVCPRRHFPVTGGLSWAPARLSPCETGPWHRTGLQAAPWRGRPSCFLYLVCRGRTSKSPVPQACGTEGAQPPCPPQSQAGQEPAAACPPRPTMPTPPALHKIRSEPAEKEHPSLREHNRSMPAGLRGPEESV